MSSSMTICCKTYASKVFDGQGICQNCYLKVNMIEGDPSLKILIDKE